MTDSFVPFPVVGFCFRFRIDSNLWYDPSRNLTNKRRPLLIIQRDPSTAESSNGSAQDGDERDDEEGKCGPVDEAVLRLVLEDGEEGEADD